MSDPVYPISIPAKQWTKIATAVTSGNIYKKSPATYKGARVDTGNDAPTVKEQGNRMFEDSPNREEFANSTSSDIYVYSDVAGVLSTDLT